MFFLGTCLTTFLLFTNALGQTGTTLHDLVIPSSSTVTYLPSPAPVTEITVLHEPEHKSENEHETGHEDEHGHGPDVEQERRHEPEQRPEYEPQIVHLTAAEQAHGQLPTNMKIIKEILEQILTLDDVHLEVIKEMLPVTIEAARLILHFT